MPELPEVETIVRGLDRRVKGRRIESVEFLWGKTCVGDPDATAAALAGQRIVGVRRWGKYILFDLRKDGERSVLVVHLRMTGNFLFEDEPGPWTRVIAHLDRGLTMVFHDIRKFGRWQHSKGLPPRLAELGPEPLEIPLDEFTARLRRRKAQAKAVLLDQEFLRGLGNIYCDEALFRARIHPKTNTGTIGPARAARLHQAIQAVLEDAIEQGGTTLRDYVDSDGEKGYFQLRTLVYGKTGEPCKVCESPIRRAIIAGRSTHYCSICQRR